MSLFNYFSELFAPKEKIRQFFENIHEYMKHYPETDIYINDEKLLCPYYIYYENIEGKKIMEFYHLHSEAKNRREILSNDKSITTLKGIGYFIPRNQ